MQEQALTLLPVAPAYLDWRGHRLALYSSGAGSPVLLIHSINAAASAFEMRAPFSGLGDGFAMHALDLLGYGNSDRPARRYCAGDYIDQIGAALAHIGQPSALVASSLGAAYAVAAAARWPERVSSLVLVCPTGMGLLTEPTGPVGWAVYRVLRGPVGRAIFRLLTSRRSTRLFLGRQAYHDPRSMTDEAVEGFHLTARRPGAYYAPICFLTGLLNCDIRDSFPRLRQPVLIVWGRQATTTPLRSADAFLAANPRARLEVIEGASMLVQDERPAEFNALVRDYLLAL
ncbi:MAG: alpha/beta fold hydrolase [Chloroflexales bacterium]|nr:alpha/beta fold hydrolase [Chloroflexales bacterium]